MTTDRRAVENAENATENTESAKLILGVLSPIQCFSGVYKVILLIAETLKQSAKARHHGRRQSPLCGCRQARKEKRKAPLFPSALQNGASA